MMNRHAMPILAALIFTAAVPCVASAQSLTRTATIAGSGLSVDSPCARSVDIQPDPSLHGQAVVNATADHQEELDRLLFETRTNARISTGNRNCWRPDERSNFNSTLQLTIRVPAGFAVGLAESGAGRYTVGPVNGALSIDLSGAAQFQAEQVTTTSIDLSGSGDVTIARVDGNSHIDLSGHGHVTVADGSMPKLAMDISGAGGLKIAKGQVGTAAISLSGFGTATIGGVTDNATVDISGAGSVHFAKLTGGLVKDVSGAGSVTVGE